MRAPSSFLPVPAILAALLLAGCDVADSGGDAYVRVVNASMDYASVDLYLDDKLKIASTGYEAARCLQLPLPRPKTWARELSGSQTNV